MSRPSLNVLPLARRRVAKVALLPSHFRRDRSFVISSWGQFEVRSAL